MKKKNSLKVALNFNFDNFDKRINELEKEASKNNCSKELKALFDDIHAYKSFFVKTVELYVAEISGKETKFQSARPLSQKLKNTRSAYIVISKNGKLIVADSVVKNIKVWNKDHTFVLSNNKQVKAISVASASDKAPALFQNINRAKEALALANKLYDKDMFHIEEVEVDK